MTLQELTQLLTSGQFHHATVRNPGHMFEALHVYCRDTTENGFRGYRHVGEILKDSPDYTAALDVVSETGTSLGQYGEG